MTGSTLTGQVAAYAAATTCESLPAHVAERVKFIIFDELACAVIGRELIAGELIERFVSQMGGAAEATVIGGGRAPAAMAALANGTAGHADEFDGAHVTDGHPGAVIVHACTAVAERSGVSGKQLINAVSLGYDIGTRLVQSVGGAFALRNVHHIHSDHLHGFGAAIAAARLLGLGSDGVRHAAALAAGHAGGLAVVFEERRHMSKALSTGQGAFAGASAALLASIGFEGHDNVFDSRHGPLAWSRDGAVNVMLEGLGTIHAVLGSNFKFYSAGYPIHAPVEAALNIMAKAGLSLADVADVAIHLTSHTADTVSNRDMPSICAEDMVSVAMVNGGLGFDLAHSDEAVAAPKVRQLRPLVHVVRDAELDRTQPNGRGARVFITTRAGERHSETIEHPRGHALRGGVGWLELEQKWDDLLPARLGDAGYTAFRSACRSLEAVDDVNELMAILGGRRT
jgi:2-methylcitrate dehydratase PrpD